MLTTVNTEPMNNGELFTNCDGGEITPMGDFLCNIGVCSCHTPVCSCHTPVCCCHAGCG